MSDKNQICYNLGSDFVVNAVYDFVFHKTQLAAPYCRAHADLQLTVFDAQRLRMLCQLHTHRFFPSKLRPALFQLSTYTQLRDYVVQ